MTGNRGMTTEPLSGKASMAKDETKSVNRDDIQADREGFNALQGIEGYDPQNPAYTVAKGQTAFNNMEDELQVAVQKRAAADAAEDDAVAAEWAFHNFMLGAKEQVIAQFGSDSNEIQSIGLKKKSERKSPKRKNGQTPPPA